MRNHDQYLATVAVLDGGKLFVAGGWHSRRLQMWDPDENSWTVKADLPAERDSAASTVVDGRWWIMGGYVDDVESRSVIIYDAENDTWAEGDPLPAPRANFQATLDHAGSIVLVGAGLPFRRVAGQWVELPTSPVDRLLAPAAGSVVLG